MLNNLLEQAKENYGACSLDLAGEIILQNSNRSQLLSLSQSEHDLINDCVKVLKNHLPMLKIEKKDSLAECRIVLFAYQRPTAKVDLLEIIKSELMLLVQRLLANENLRVSMNIFGCFMNGKEKQKYRFLNQGDQVEYVITESELVGVLGKLFSHQVKAYVVTLILAVLFLDMCYEAFIAGHGWQLTNIWDLFISKSVPSGVNPKDVI